MHIVNLDLVTVPVPVRLYQNFMTRTGTKNIKRAMDKQRSECLSHPTPFAVLAENCRELPEIEIVQDVFEFLFDLEEPELAGHASNVSLNILRFSYGSATWYRYR
jgi:hypothetical protein